MLFPLILGFFLLCDPVAGSKAGQISIDKGIQGAVHNCVDIRSFAAGTGVLDQGIGHEDIVADLAAPLDLLLNALDVVDVGQVLTLTDLNQLGAQQTQSGVLVRALA